MRVNSHSEGILVAASRSVCVDGFSSCLWEPLTQINRNKQQNKTLQSKLACHRFYELQKDNKAVVRSGSSPLSCGGAIKMTSSYLHRWSLHWPWTPCWERRRSLSPTTRFPSATCVSTPSRAWPCRCSRAPGTATPLLPRQLGSRPSLPPNRYSDLTLSGEGINLQFHL